MNKRNKKIKKTFTIAVPNFIETSFLELTETTTVQDLSTVVTAQKNLELCPIDDWSEDAFKKEVGPSLSKILVAALTKYIQQRNELKQQQKIFQTKSAR